MATMTRFRAILVVVLLAGCSGIATRTTFLNSLIGQNEQVVQQRLGPPTRVLSEGGNRILVYEQGTVQWAPEGHIDYYLPYFGPSTAGRPENVTERGCQTRITVENGIVRSFTFSGNTC